MSKKPTNKPASENQNQNNPAPEKSKPASNLVIARKLTLKPIQKMAMTAKARIGGLVAKTETVTTQYGDSTRFIGNFAAKISESGKWDDTVTIRAGAAFLPKAAENILLGAVAARINDENFNGVEFAIEVSKVESEKSKTGYEYEVRSLMEVAEAEDKVLALLA